MQNEAANVMLVEFGLGSEEEMAILDF